MRHKMWSGSLKFLQLSAGHGVLYLVELGQVATGHGVLYLVELGQVATGPGVLYLVELGQVATGHDDHGVLVLVQRVRLRVRLLVP